ncbi:MAG: zinc ribbon domain-containing protein [Candidatus Omnitrophica bacterium]|nr:zinc ribbon domain-containing protein [Candidatus Omnitrophota bacterium]
MPTYEYECQNCTKKFEIFQSMTDQPINKCPTCGGTVKRLIGCGAGIIFKGPGFFVTDYKRSAKPTNESTTKKDNTCAQKAEKKCDGCSQAV